MWSAQYSLHTAWLFSVACLWLVSGQDCWQCNDTCPPTLPLRLWNLFCSLGTGRCKQQTTKSSSTVPWNIPLKCCKSRKLPVSVKNMGLFKYSLISQSQFLLNPSVSSLNCFSHRWFLNFYKLAFSCHKHQWRHKTNGHEWDHLSILPRKKQIGGETVP